MVSEMRSHTLSGCPSVTDSEEKKLCHRFVLSTIVFKMAAAASRFVPDACATVALLAIDNRHGSFDIAKPASNPTRLMTSKSAPFRRAFRGQTRDNSVASHQFQQRNQ